MTTEAVHSNLEIVVWGTVLRWNSALIIFLSCYIPNEAVGAKNCPIEIVAQVDKLLHRRVVHQPFDNPPSDWSQAQRDVRRLMLNHPEEFDLFFQIVSKEDFQKMADHVDQGKWKANPDVIARFQALRSLVLDNKNDIGWGADGSIVSRIWTHHPDFRSSGNEPSLGGTLAGVDTSTLTTFERELVLRALNTGDGPTRVGRGNVLQRFFLPLAGRIERILNYNNHVRARLDLAEELEGVFQAVLDHPELKAADAAGSKELRAQWERVVDKVKGIRKELENVYGQDITTGGIQAVGTKKSPAFDIYAFARRMPENLGEVPAEPPAEFNQMAVRAMNVLNRVLGKAKIAKTNKPRTVEDYFPAELKIRHRQYTEETAEALGRRNRFLNEESGYSTTVDYSYKVTETYSATENYTDAQGKSRTRTVVKTRIVTRYGTKEIDLSVGDILVHRLNLEGHATSSPGFGGRITQVYDDHGLVKATEAVASQEQKFRAAVRTAEEALGGWVQNHVQNLSENAVLEKIVAARQQLETVAAEASQYSELKESAVKKQWSGDQYPNFRGRNLNLAASARTLTKRLEVYEEQFRRRQPELVVVPDIPNYSREIGQLWRRTVFAWAGTALPIASLGTCWALMERDYFTHRQEMPPACEAAFGWLFDLLGRTRKN